MIVYNPKDWFRLIFQFHVADTVRSLMVPIVAVGVYTAAFVYIDAEVLHIELPNTAVIHTLLGAVISLLLVFRTNSAYDRWWEGRKHWGALVNSVRNLSMQCNAVVGPQDMLRRRRLRFLLGSFPYALKEHLRGERSWGPDEEALRSIIHDRVGADHVPNAIAAAITQELHGAYRDGILTGEQLLAISPSVLALTDITGACERIRNTPIPYSYNLFIKKFLFLYTITLPFSVAAPYGYAAIPVVMFVFYALASLEYVAEEIEDPFGLDANDLPTDELASRMRINVHDLLPC